MAKKTQVDNKTVDGMLKALLILSRTVEHVLERQAVEAAVGEALSASKVQIIRLLGQRGHQTSTRLAYYLGVSKPAVSQLIETMVRDRLILRKTAPQDRREIELRLSAKGKQRYEAIRRQQRHLMRNLVRTIGGTSKGNWASLFEDIAAGLATADKNFADYCLQCDAHSDGTCVLEGGKADCRFLRESRPESEEGPKGRAARGSKRKPARQAKRSAKA